MATNDVLDRLEALLAAATHGPWDRIRSQDYAYIVALHEAAPALIRLARATVEFEKHEIRTEVKCYAELLNAIKALGEVRL